MEKTCVIVQARVGSTRLPNKVLMDLCGRPVLWHVLNRLRKSQLISGIIIATTILPDDDAIQQFCEENDAAFYRGSSENVLSRYYEAAQKYDVKRIIRITSDCPVIDPVLIDEMIKEFEKSGADYLSNSIVRTFPRGLDTEIFPFRVLEQVFYEAAKPHELEHVTPYIYQHPELFKLQNFAGEIDYSALRWTLDTEEDYRLIKEIYDALYEENGMFYWKDVLKLFNEKPELAEINRHIEQKKLGG